ncbi:Dimeric alpha-beta barrel [Mycena sanguinolenta]|uniref:Dimeric alpha-beta barrel n=1 Tax=Mycena sanguinolenta TaxID=230812 RepID=A0A8H7CYA3_9AGAR|nr:Dimeric alpha-beta barrel [Mycena sanguinolenta]
MVHTVVVHLYTQPGKESEMKKVLITASQTYSKDKGTLAWFVMQNEKDSTAWCIVERYENKDDVKTHAANPFFKTFPKLVGPLLDPKRPTQILRHNELDADADVRAKL